MMSESMNENSRNEDDKNEEESQEDFAELLEHSFLQTEKLEPGRKVEARILKITQDWVFLDVGQKGEGVLDRKELLDAEGNLTVREGDLLPAYFQGAKGGELLFTTRLSSGGAGLDRLEEAWRNGIPVEGVIEKEVKGGVEVKISGSIRAFCPFSQMDVRRSDPPENMVGKRMDFKVIQFDERGRNIVVSHRALLEAERARQKEQMKQTLQEGMKVRGTITSLREFGAFIDIGGIEGLLPISEIAWGRIENINEVLTTGQEVEVVIKSLDWEKNRFSFSMKEARANPWETAEAHFPVDSVHTGKIVRLAPFGAFVALGEGLDGLIHISKLGGGKKIKHPREVVREGDDIEVKIDAVDLESRRISLAPMAQARLDQEGAEALRDYQRQAEKPPSMGTLADLFKGGSPRKKR